ncbi:vWA domain-containing protein, partial [Psychromonas hadalis]|uniref:vWA domain-containing protein n=1 Tax=Psychromonas hadalis TaxID=211669 RepID=UPI0003B66B1F
MLPEITTLPLDFLRPAWLLGLIVVFLFSILSYKNSKKTDKQALIAPHLSAHIVSKTVHSTKHQFVFNIMVAITCIALAGPTWRSVNLPVYEIEKAQVIVFDLSYSMLATDLKPSRLAQAKFKAIDLIKQWSEGEKALIAYAGDAFTISPLTRDGNSIISHIPHLSPEIMPVTGSRADLALNKAIELLENAGYSQGQIVFISDGITESQAEIMTEQLKKTDWIVSVLAVATEQGAPIRLPDGTLLKSASGEIVVPKLIAQPLYDITRATNGLYLTSRNNSSDIEQLGHFFKNKEARKNKSEQKNADLFSIDDGYWLSFLLLPLFLLLFRKGVFFALLLAVYLPLTSPPLEAAETSVWKNSEQNAFQAYQDENYQTASELYGSALDQGSALYKNKQYEQALEQFNKATIEQPNNANTFYNQGNSYAQLKQFDKAIEAYDKALGIDAGMQQATENRRLVKQIKDQQEQEKQQDKNQQGKNKEQQDSQQDDQQKQDAEQDNQDTKPSEQKKQNEQDAKQSEQKKQNEQDAKQSEQKK